MSTADTRPGKLLHSYGKSPFLMGKLHYKWPFSIAMLNYQRVTCLVLQDELEKITMTLSPSSSECKYLFIDPKMQVTNWEGMRPHETRSDQQCRASAISLFVIPLTSSIY